MPTEESTVELFWVWTRDFTVLSFHYCMEKRKIFKQAGVDFKNWSIYAPQERVCQHLPSLLLPHFPAASIISNVNRQKFCIRWTLLHLLIHNHLWHTDVAGGTSVPLTLWFLDSLVDKQLFPTFAESPWQHNQNIIQIKFNWTGLMEHNKAKNNGQK